jgi:hypothetical protein
MFRHYCVILRELVVSALLGYISMSNAVVGIAAKLLYCSYMVGLHKNCNNKIVLAILL